MEGRVAGHPSDCGIVVHRWQAWGPLQPDEVGQLDLETFSSLPGPPPGVLPAECSSYSGTSKQGGGFIFGSKDK